METLPPNLIDPLREKSIEAWKTARPYLQFVAEGNEVEQKRWGTVYSQTSLSHEQGAVTGSFKRELNLLCLAGLWCGDCASQVPLIARIAEGSQKVNFRCVDTENVKEYAAHFRIHGAQRVPVLIALSEDFLFLGSYGDRPLATYRAKVSKEQGAACALPGAKLDTPQRDQELADWLREIERWQLLLQVSPFLRKRHKD